MKWFNLIVIFGLVLLFGNKLVDSKISDRRLCADEKCSSELMTSDKKVLLFASNLHVFELTNDQIP